MARQLLEVIYSGEEALAKDIILNGSYGCIDSQTSRRDGTALFYCCCRGQQELVSLLVKKGAHIEARTKWSATPLHAAVDNNHIEIVRYLIHLGADINAQTHHGDTPLHLAVLRGHTDIVHLLIRFGASLTLINESNLTPLNEAVRQGHSDIAHFLRAVHEWHSSPLSSNDPSGSMMMLSPPTAQYSPCPHPITSTRPEVSSKPPKCQNDTTPVVNCHIDNLITNNYNDSSIGNIHNNNPLQNINKSSNYCSPPCDTSRDTGSLPVELDHCTSRVPEESMDPTVFLSMGVSNLCVPALGSNLQRQTSSASSSVSMTSDCGTSLSSGLRSDVGSAVSMSSISDISSCGGDARREDFDGHDRMDATRLGLVEARRISHPLLGASSNHSGLSRTYSSPDSGLVETQHISHPLSSGCSNHSGLSRTYSNPDSFGPVSGFSDIFNSSLFALGSLAATPSSSMSSSNDHGGTLFSITDSGHHVSSAMKKESLPLSFNIIQTGEGDAKVLHQHFNSQDIARRENTASKFFNKNGSTKSKPANSSCHRDQEFPVSVSKGCCNKWSIERHPSNDLSSIKSLSSPPSPSSPLPVMTYINIPIHE